MLKRAEGIALSLKDGDWQGPTSVKREAQRGSRWCWAACVAMVLKAFKNQKTQCQIAEAAFNTPCCDKEQHLKPGCDRGYKIADIGALWKMHGVDAESHDAVRWNDIEEELKPKKNEGKPGRPIEIFLAIGGADSADGHLVLIVGATIASGKRMVTIADPASNSTGFAATDFDLLGAGLRYGKWTKTWTNLAWKKKEA